MADEKLKIDVQVAGREDVKELKEELKDLTQKIKVVELGFKSGNLTTQEAQQHFMKLANEIRNTGASETQLVDITQRLWHANNRVEMGFKSLATETISANRMIRELNQEQKLGNALLGRMQGSLGLLGNAFGGLGGQASTAIGIFQQAEDTILTMGVAAQASGGKFAQLGTAIAGAGSALTALAAIGIGEFMLFQNLAENIERSNNELRKLRGETEKMVEAPFWKRMLAQMAGSGANQALSFFGALAKTDIELAKKVFEEKHKIVLDEVVVTGEKEKQTKEVKKQVDAQKELFDMIHARGFQPVDRGGAISRLEPRGVNARQLGGALAGSNRLPQLSEVVTEETKKSEQQLNSFEDAFNGSASRMASTIGNSIGQGFTDAFGIGHTLLGQFVDDFISQLTSLAAMGIIKGIFSAATGGAGGFLGGFTSVFGLASGGYLGEPVFGVGARSGQAYQFAESGGEYVLNQSQMGMLLSGARGGGGNAGMNRIANALENGRLKARGRDLVFVYDKASQVIKNGSV